MAMYNIEKNYSKKILIISPINQWGGVNVEAGFIAQFYKNSGHVVKILSTGKHYDDCSIFKFIDIEDYINLNEYILKKKWLFKKILKILNYIKPLPIPLSHRLNNVFFKRYLLLNKFTKHYIKSIIDEYEVIVLCNQLTGHLVLEVLSIKHQKKIIFRITGQISKAPICESTIDKLNKVDAFVVHSVKNKSILFKKLNTVRPIYIIDQCVYNEKFYRSKNYNNKVKLFYVLGRLDKIKNIDLIIRAFKEVENDKIYLNIYGTGEESKYLERLIKNDKRIKLHKAVDLDGVYKLHINNDCLIIASTIEAGPYTGIEAMAAGNFIISTRVGAMEDRLDENYTFFYDGTLEGLKNAILKICNQTTKELQELKNTIHSKYQENYTVKAIQERYQQLID